MAKENMQMGEGFSAQKIGGNSPPPDEPKTRHYVIGWSLIAAIITAGVWFLMPATQVEKPTLLQERPGLSETLGKKMGGVLYYDIIRASINLPKSWDIAAQVAGVLPGHGAYEQTHFGPIHNTIVNEGETALRDCFGGTGTPTCTDTQNFKYHGLGTSSAAIAETDGGCTTELTTQYTGDVRATGSQTNNGANIYRTVGTNTIDSGGPVSIEEFCLMAAASGAANMWTRILTSTITLQTNDGLQTTYDLTIE